MLHKLKVFLLYGVPVIVMIALIPIIKDDYALAAIYTAFILGLLFTKSEKHDIVALIFGFVGITISELFFVHTGVETFTRQTLFGLLPFWLPFLWAYAFVTIKRSLAILSR